MSTKRKADDVSTPVATTSSATPPPDLSPAHKKRKPNDDNGDDKNPPNTPSATLDYPSLSRVTSKSVPFQQPTQLLSFSYDENHEMEFTDSALRYYVEPPLNASLKYGYNHWKRKADTRGRLDSLLHAVSRVKKQGGGPVGEIGLVTWRGIITKILTAPYEEREGWDMNVMYVKGTLYLEEHLSDERLHEKNNMDEKHRQQTYYGYAFESYCTSDKPVRGQTDACHPIGWGGDVDTNVQWCSVVRTKLGDTRMVLGGEVDCVRGKYTGQTDTFVELKTSLTIRGPPDAARFEKKLLKFYFQSFLLGVPEIVVGFRTPSGQLTTTQTFKTIQLPRLVRGKPGAWDPQLCLEWGHSFLSFLKGELGNWKAHDETVPVWRVRFVPRKGVSVEILDQAGVEDVVGGEDRVGFLPKWFWDELEESSITGNEPHIPQTPRQDGPHRETGKPTPAVGHAGWVL